MQSCNQGFKLKSFSGLKIRKKKISGSKLLNQDNIGQLYGTHSYDFAILGPNIIAIDSLSFIHSC